MKDKSTTEEQDHVLQNAFSKRWDSSNRIGKDFATTFNTQPLHPTEQTESVRTDEQTPSIVPTVQSEQFRRSSSKQRKASLEEYRQTFLNVPKIEDRKTVFVSGATRDRLDEIARKLGGRKMSVSGLLENLALHHLEMYKEDMEVWKKI